MTDSIIAVGAYIDSIVNANSEDVWTQQFNKTLTTSNRTWLNLDPESQVNAWEMLKHTWKIAVFMTVFLDFVNPHLTTSRRK